LPPTHVWPPVHWWPHVPQLSRSLLRLVSQPLAAKLSQSPNPGLQLKPHVLATHFAPVTLLPVDGQLLAQLPQWLAVLVRLVSQPLFTAPSQSSKLGLHMKPHVLLVHFAPATLAPVDGQACPQVPQFATSIAGTDSHPLAPSPSQSLKPLSQMQARLPLQLS